MHRSTTVAFALALALVGGCARRERPEVARARASETFLRSQIAGLEKTIGQVERGEVTTTDQVAIGLSEDLAKGLLNASLPLETIVAERLRVRVDSASRCSGDEGWPVVPGDGQQHQYLERFGLPRDRRHPRRLRARGGAAAGPGDARPLRRPRVGLGRPGRRRDRRAGARQCRHDPERHPARRVSDRARAVHHDRGPHGGAGRREAGQPAARRRREPGRRRQSAAVGAAEGGGRPLAARRESRRGGEKAP